MNTSIEGSGHAVTATAKSNSTVVMQTARTMVSGKDATKKVPVTILFDSASQKSYVTEAFRRNLAYRWRKQRL